MAHWTVRKLTKTYGRYQALQSFDLDIDQGSFNILLGANGSGKSTLLRCLAGLEIWTSGSISLNGRDRAQDRGDFNKGLIYLSEDLKPFSGPIERLFQFYRCLSSEFEEARFRRILSIGDLNERQDYSSLSRGQKMLALTALGMATRPSTLILDEVTAVFDPHVRIELMQELADLNRNFSTTVILATNIASEVQLVQGRVIILARGSIIAEGKLSELSSEFAKVRSPIQQALALKALGFTFVGRNADGSGSFLGPKSRRSQIDFPIEDDLRAISAEEVFVYYAERGHGK